MHRGLDAAVRREIVLRHRAGTTPTALAQALHIDPSSVHNTLKKLEGIGLLKMSGKKRMLTNLGIQVAQLL